MVIVGSVIKKARRRRLWQWCAFAVVVLINAFVLTAWLVAGSLVAPANQPVGAPPSDLRLVATTLASDSGATVAAWYLPADNAHATVILAHPLGGSRRTMLGRARLFHHAGYAVVLIDLQAHGESVGSHITFGYLEQHDVLAAIRFARKSNPTLTEAVHDRIALRLGALSDVLAPALLCQLSPRWGISPEALRPIDGMRRLRCPVLVIAGDRDQHTTLTETQRLYDAAREPKQLVIVPGAGHVDLLAFNSKQYEETVLAFLSSYLSPWPVSG